MKLILSLLLVVCASHAYEPGSGDADYNDTLSGESSEISDPSELPRSRRFLSSFSVGRRVMQCQDYEGRESCHMLDDPDALVLTGSGDSRSYCEKRNRVLFVCDLEHVDKESYFVGDYFQRRRLYVHATIVDVKSLVVSRVCGLDNYNFINIGYLRFIHFDCMTGSLQASNVTMDAFREPFHNLMIHDSTIKNFRVNNKISHLELVNTTIQKFSCKLEFLSAEYHSAIDRSSIVTVQKLLVDANYNMDQTFTIVECEIDHIPSDSFVSTVETYIEHSTIQKIRTHGIHFQNSAALRNITFNEIEKHGIVFEPQPNSFIEFSRLRIENCSKPCFAIIVNDEREYSLNISEVVIGNSHYHGELNDYIEILNYKNPLSKNIVSGQSEFCYVADENQLICKFNKSKEEFSLVPGVDENYSAISLMEHGSLTIYYSCVAKFVLQRITGNMYPSDNLNTDNCLKPMRITGKFSNLNTIDIRTPTNIAGYAFSFNRFFAYAPLNISGQQISMESMLHYVAKRDSLTEWHDVYFNEIYNTTVDGTLTIYNSSIMSLRNLTINDNGNLTLVGCLLEGTYSVRVNKGGLLAFVFTALPDNDGDIFLEEGAKVYLDHHVQDPAYRNLELKTIMGKGNAPLISISSYDQVDGPFRWYVNSGFWILDVVKVIHPTPADGFPAFQNESAASLYELHEQKLCAFDRQHHLDRPDSSHPNTLCDLKSVSIDIVGSHYNPSKWQDILTHTVSVYFKNGNTVRFQFGEVDYKHVSFENCKKVVLIEDDYEKAVQNFHLDSTFSPVLRGSLNVISLNNSNISVLSNVVSNFMSASHSIIGTFNLEVDKLTLNDTKICLLEKLLIKKLVEISNCHIEHINSSAIFADENSHVSMINVTIGTMERESFILRNTFKISNVTVKFAAESSFILPHIEGTIFKGIDIEKSDGDPFHILDFSRIEMTDVFVGGKEYKFHGFKAEKLPDVPRVFYRDLILEKNIEIIILVTAFAAFLTILANGTMRKMNGKSFYVIRFEDDGDDDGSPLLDEQNVEV